MSTTSGLDVIVTGSVTIGKIVVTQRELPARSLIACGPAICDVGPSIGKRFFDELTKIREALHAASMVLVDREFEERTRPATPAEVHLARMLVELEIYS